MGETPAESAEIFGPTAELLLRFAVALGLGVLLGLERERTKDPETGFAGIRTFALISLTGAVSAWAGDTLGIAWILPLTFGALAALVLASYVVSATKGSVGITTEVTALLTFMLGVVCERGEFRVASAVAVAVMLVLVLKNWLHAITRRLSMQDVSATVQFAIVTLIVLPLVPNQSFGPPPFDALNPYRIWLMVVLISGLDFASWILVKSIGREHGIGLTGLLGGLVSSTATTLTFTKRSRQEPEQSASFAVAILLASLVMLGRVAVVLAVVSMTLLRVTWPAIVAMMVASLVVLVWVWRRSRAAEGEKGSAELKAEANPFELSKAVRFALLFAVVSLAARAAEVWLGDSGLYLAGALGGLTDVDAITLSMSELTSRDTERTVAAGRAVVLALVANTLVKGGISAAAGSREIAKIILPAVLIVSAVGLAVAFLVG